MLDTSNNWQLFGHDFSQIGKRWQAAWRDFLWGDESPLRGRLDEVVRLRDQQSVCYRHSSREVGASAPVACDAILLPDDLYLSRTLRLPRAAETDLDAVMALEVAANSPFPEDDTGFGWRVVSRDAESIQVQLAIVSLSSTMSYLGREFDAHDARAQEVWAGTDGEYIMLHGFGETLRQQRYRQRLFRVAALAAVAALLLVAMAALAAGTKYLELRRYQHLYAAVKQEAVEASNMRDALVTANETITSVDQLVRSYPNPHEEIVRLTGMLGDDTYISLFSMEGNEITLRGQAADAAAVLQQFTAEPAYAAVTAPDAFRAYPGGLEEFHFRIVLAPGEQQ